MVALGLFVVVACVAFFLWSPAKAPVEDQAGEAASSTEKAQVGEAAGESQDGSVTGCPYAVPLGQVEMEIVEIFFTDVVHGIDGNQMKLDDEKKEKFRLGVVAIKIIKPAGESLEIAAADLTLHYNHGDDTEAAPCEGLSGFSTTLDVDRPMKLSRVMGPGFTKQATGARSTEASEIYVDATFAYLEPDIRECWICVGQPSTTEPYVAPGWSN